MDIAGQQWLALANATNLSSVNATGLNVSLPPPTIPGNVSVVANASNVTNCTDSDGGNMPLIAGSVALSPPPQTFYDVCLPASRLREYFCQVIAPRLFRVMQQEYTCRRGCSYVAGRGRCNP